MGKIYETYHFIGMMGYIITMCHLHGLKPKDVLGFDPGLTVKEASDALYAIAKTGIEITR